jgi:uncharacterized membrane protein YfcA
VVVGFFSGLFGVGGGFIAVPLLTLLLGFELKRASATSLVVIVITAAAGVVGFAAHSGVVWIPALMLSIGSVTGSYVGARLLRFIPSVYLMWGFATLLIGLAVRLLFDAGQQGSGSVATSGLALLGMLGLGLGAGLLAGLLGVGGGILVVPILVIAFGLTNVEAKGTSLVMMIPAGISGSIVNLKNQLVDIRAGVTIGLVAAAVSYAGVAVAVIMPSELSNVLFALLMLYTAVQFIVRAYRTTGTIDR